MRAVALLVVLSAPLAGCGSAGHPSATGASSAGSAPAGRPAPTPPPRTSALDQRFLTSANFVCRTVRAGAPGLLSPAATKAELSSRGRAAGAAAQRTATSLQRLGTQTSHQAALSPLVAEYRSLARIYRIALSPKLVAAAVPAIARSIVATEGRASSTARSLGLLSCAPSPAVG